MNATFQYQLGMVYWNLGDKDEARRLLVTALRLNPNFPESQSAHNILHQLFIGQACSLVQMPSAPALAAAISSSSV